MEQWHTQVRYGYLKTLSEKCPDFQHIESQICMSTERVIVQSAVADRLLNEIRRIVQDLKAGDVVNDSSASLGALFTESSADNIVGMIKDAEKDGATVVLGDTSKQSSIVVPHLVKNVKPGMRLWDRETFGPGTIFPLRLYSVHWIHGFSSCRVRHLGDSRGGNRAGERF